MVLFYKHFVLCSWPETCWCGENNSGHDPFPSSQGTCPRVHIINCVHYYIKDFFFMDRRILTRSEAPVLRSSCFLNNLLACWFVCLLFFLKKPREQLTRGTFSCYLSCTTVVVVNSLDCVIKLFLSFFFKIEIIIFSLLLEPHRFKKQNLFPPLTLSFQITVSEWIQVFDSMIEFQLLLSSEFVGADDVNDGVQRLPPYWRLEPIQCHVI